MLPIARFSVGALLNLYPDIEFHADDHFLSRASAAYLSRRFDQFLRSLQARSAPYNSWDHESSIVAYINGGGLRHIEAYEHYGELQTLRSLPFVTKRDLRTRMKSFIAPRGTTENRWGKTTTGTTGSPIVIVYGADFYFEVQLLSPRKIAARADLSECIAQRPIFCLAMNDKKNTAGTVIADSTQMNLLSVQVHVDERNKESFARITDLMATLQPACLASKPSVLEQFAMVVGMTGVRSAAAPVFVISSASMLSPEVRRTVQECLGTRVIDAYTMTEFGVVASECKVGQLHIDTTSVYVESVDDVGQSVPEHVVGELVITGLVNVVTPLVRYRTGDLGALSTQTCTCGVPGPRITHIVGKRVACFRLPDGSAFSPTFFNDLFGRFACLSEFQITQKALQRYEVEVELNPQARAEDCSVQLESIRSYVHASLKGTSEVTIAVGTIQTDNKFQRYRTEV